jgi:hypothetical protein
VSSSSAASRLEHQSRTPFVQVGEGGCDQVGDDAIELEPVPKLRVRGPVGAALPTEPLSLHAEDRGDEDRARLVEQPVRLRLARAEW